MSAHSSPLRAASPSAAVVAEQRDASRPHLVRRLAVGALVLAATGAACAAEGDPGLAPRFPLAQVFTFLFLMLGPFKIIGPFARMTRDADARLTRQVAVRATLFAAAALLTAAFLGETFLAKYGVPVPVLSLSAGIILFLVALRTILQQFEPPAPSPAAGPTEAPAAGATRLALALAFPSIVTPHGIAALVVFLAMGQSAGFRMSVAAVVVAIMLSNLVVMLVTRRLLPVLALVLPILGAVLGIVQVALGLQIVHNSLRAMGVS